MVIKKILIGKSTQVFQVGQPEYWNKCSVEAEIGESENVKEAIEKLQVLVDESLKRIAPAEGITFSSPIPKKETFADLKKELNVTTK